MSPRSGIRGRLDGLGLRGRVAAVAAIVTASVLTAATASAYWVASPVTATGTVGATTLTVTASGLGSIATTYRNETPTALSKAASITVTNTTSTSSTTVPPVTIALGYTGDSTLAGATTVKLWSTTTPSTCSTTVPSTGVTTTTLAAGASSVVPLANNGGAVSWCIVTSIASLQSISSTTGSRSVTPQVTATTNVGNFGATASTSGVQSSAYIYPGATVNTVYYSTLRPLLDTTLCLDIRGSGGVGTDSITFPCKASTLANQVFRFSTASTAGYYTISPQYVAANLDNGSSTASGAGVTIQTPSTSAGQQWMPQQVSAGVYQLVNLASGMCLTAVPIGSLSDYPANTQTACSGASSQQFQITVPPLALFACSNTGSNASNDRLGYAWERAQNGGYVVQAQDASGAWQQIVATTATTSTGATVAGSLPTSSALLNWTAGNYAVRVLDGAGNVVASAAAGATGSIKVTSGSYLFTTYKYLRCN